MIFLYYYLIVNVVALLFYGIDKQKAIKNRYRISENSLLLFSIIGGGIGSLVGMYLFHHKTRKPLFKYGVPFLTVLSLIIIYYFELY